MGTEIEGVIEANTQEDAVSKLKEGGLVVSTIEPAEGEHDINLSINGRKTKENVLALVCNQFAIIMQAGLPIVRTVRLVAEQTADKTMKKLLEQVADDVAAGYGLADSFEKYGEALPTTFVETIRAGEESGQLETVFRRLSDYYDKLSKSKNKVKSAMIYPLFVIALAVIVIIIIMVFAVPTFTSTFASMGVQLPWITQFMIDSSAFWNKNGLIVLVIVILAILAFRVALKRDDFHMKCSRLALHLPVIGRIILMSASSQYAGTMGIMMEAGLSVVKSVQVTSRVISNFFLGKELDSILPDLEAGKALAPCLAKLDVFPSLVAEMTGVGEETGSLETTLGILSDYYDNEADVATSRALSIMEPTIIVILAVIVCALLLAVYLPVFGMYGGATSM